LPKAVCGGACRAPRSTYPPTRPSTRGSLSTTGRKARRGSGARAWFFWHLANDPNFKYPYQRTGRYGDSWLVEKIKDGYRLRSTYPAAKFVAGGALNPEQQYHIHKTRWIPLRVAMEEAIRELPEDIRDNVVLAARRRGF
jgi:hypothetical protein